MIPVGTALGYWKLVGKGLAGFDTFEAIGDARYTVHRTGQDDAVPMNGTGFGQQIADPQGYRIALPPAQDRRRQRVINGSSNPRRTGEIDCLLTDGQIEICPTQGLRALLFHGSGEDTAPKAHTREGTTHRQALYKSTARQAHAPLGYWIMNTTHGIVLPLQVSSQNGIADE